MGTRQAHSCHRQQPTPSAGRECTNPSPCHLWYALQVLQQARMLSQILSCLGDILGVQKNKDRGILCAPPNCTSSLIKSDNCMDGEYEDTKKEKGTVLHSKFAISGGPVHWRHRQRRPCTTDVAQYRLVSAVSPERNQETGSAVV